MNKTLNPLLKESRLRLVAQVTKLEEAYASFSVPTEPTNPDTKPPIDPDMLQTTVEPGQGAAVSPEHERLNRYIVDVVRGLMAQYACSKDDALDLIFEVADDLEEEEMLPPMPEDDSEAEHVTDWLTAAGSIGFAAHVMEYAEEEIKAADEGASEVNEPEITV